MDTVKLIAMIFVFGGGFLLFVNEARFALTTKTIRFYGWTSSGVISVLGKSQSPLIYWVLLFTYVILAFVFLAVGYVVFNT